MADKLFLEDELQIFLVSRLRSREYSNLNVLLASAARFNRRRTPLRPSVRDITGLSW